jgi:hypothetical protein
MKSNSHLVAVIKRIEPLCDFSLQLELAPVYSLHVIYLPVDEFTGMRK